jgi:hypothetical protein
VEPYKNLSGDSGVLAYELSAVGIGNETAESTAGQGEATHCLRGGGACAAVGVLVPMTSPEHYWKTPFG